MIKKYSKFLKVTLCWFSLALGLNQLEAANWTADSPKMVTDPTTGTVISVWEAVDSVTYNWKIQTANFTSSGGWTSAVDLFASTIQTGYAPSISINSSGDAVAAWVGSDFTTGNSIIQAAIYSGGTWSSPTIVSDINLEFANADFQIALDDAGQVALSWSAYIGATATGSSIRAANATIAGGNVWTSPVTVSN
jgi:hypothetical protein